MKKLLIICTLVLFTSAASPLLSAAELHVGSGQSFSTIASAISASSGGDTIIIHQGTYNERGLRPKSGLSSTQRTVLKGADGEARPVINGGALTYGGPWNTTTIYIQAEDHIELNGLHVKNGPRAAIVLYDSQTDDIVIRNCKVEMDWPNGGYAADNAACIFIYANFSDVLIENNEIVSRNSGVNGIIGFRGHGEWIIRNNEMIMDGDGSGSKDCRGVYWKHAGTGAHQAVIRDNIVYATGAGTGANCGFLVYNDNTLVNNNLVYGAMKYGIWIYGNDGVPGGDNCIVTHNTVVNAGRTGVQYDTGDGGTNDIFRDNIVYGILGNSEYQAFAIWVYGPTGNHNVTMDYNCYFNGGTSSPIKEYSTSYSLASWRSRYGQDVHSMSQDPQFVNISAGDFSLAANSPCRNTASDGSHLGVDLSTVGISGGGGGDTDPPDPPEDVTAVPITG